MAIREEHFIERQGKRLVLFAGLLDEAHRQGLLSIQTDLIQTPTPENGNVAIVKALVGMKGVVPDPDGELEDRLFSGIGDASPENVGRNIAPHTIRMAETRAKARALRDAINVGVTAFEELGDEDSAQAPQSSPPTQRTGNPSASSQAANTGGERARDERGQLPATKKQLNFLTALIEDVVEGGIARFEQMASKPIGELTREEASEWIGRLSGRAV